MKAEKINTTHRKASPPVMILYCPGGGGHYWARLNPRWYTDKHWWMRERQWCDEHQEEMEEQKRKKIGQAVHERSNDFHKQPLPATRICCAPDPKSHARGAVLPASDFYLRKTKRRVDGASHYKLDARCKECRREDAREYHKNLTAEQRKQAGKKRNKARSRRRKALKKEQDRRLQLEPFRVWLEQYVRDTNVTHEVVEDRAGLAKSTVTAIINGNNNGRRYIAQSTVEKIAVGLDRPYLLSQLYGEKR